MFVLFSLYTEYFMLCEQFYVLCFTEYCMFGEQPSYNLVFTTSKTCQEWLKSKDNHYRCYYYHYQCCETCARVAQSYSHLKGKTYLKF